MVGSESGVSPENVLTPQVGVLSASVHGSVRFERILDVKLVLFKSQFNKLGIGVSSEDFVKVSSDSVLLVVEAIVVGASDSPDVLGHQLADHAPMEDFV